MDLISFQEALDLGLTLPLMPLESKPIALNKAQGRILAEDIYAQDPLPKVSNAAMDGFGLYLEDLGKSLPIVHSIYAGMDVTPLELPPHTCVKIMTGASIPKGVELVVPFEKMQSFTDTHAHAPQGFKKGDNIRFEGENIKSGDLILTKGTRLSTGHIALLASQGVVSVRVFRRLRVGVFSSGDEVIALGGYAQKHQVYDTNGVILTNLLEKHGFEPMHLGYLQDDLEAQKKALIRALDHDVIISSAGVSAGDKDFFKEMLLSMGAQIHYHGVKLKPGKPIMLASLSQKIIFGMPGNPLSCTLTFLTLVLPVLERLALSLAKPTTFKATLANPLILKGKRTHLILGQLQGGVFTPYQNNTYGAGAINALSASNAIACIHQVEEPVQSAEVLLLF
ncbi:molybdopterin molybdotransferase MoeA [Helicobacter suis]|uniref:molybdopterin molybdotransferase MoeA n=1 Tax=Helicobacter suis TaxID=104628 RepID=UPI0013D10258|nr:molybdopterin molybdotransferase MoeA [Helicobacter suis]